MCKHVDDGGLQHLMPINGRVRAIDACIAHIVAALNAANVTTISSCCGHGHRPGRIDLEDGRVLLVANAIDAADMEDRFPLDIHGNVIRPDSNLIEGGK